ncbi:MAG: hypothetical protein K6G80_08435 [Treponema sp.]|nr:hypothetical protein [Treponema sp.]
MYTRGQNLRIAYILIVLSLASFAVTEVCKLKAAHQYAVLDAAFAQVYAGQKPLDAVSDGAAPYLFFDRELSESFTRIQKDASPAGLHDFQNSIHIHQRRISQGFDRLIFFSAVILAISVMLIIIRQGEEKAKLSRVQTANEEQKKFSRNLHDGVAQDLAAVRTYLQQNDIEKSGFYLNRAFEEVRYLIDSSRINLSEPLSRLIRDTAAAFESNYEIPVQVHIASSLIDRLKSTKELDVLYILQEALSNIARHAAATQISIKIIDVADDLIIRIHDNGKGFSQEQHAAQNSRQQGGTAAGHWGLVTMQERAQALGGTLEILHEGGTTIAIRLTHPVS